MRLRRRRAARRPELQRRLARPVISVGNLSMGGTGKTPVVLHIAQWLMYRKQSPSILTRGYGRADAPDGVVDFIAFKMHDVPSEMVRIAGDEPVMLARALHGVLVCVSPDRYLAGRIAERRGCTVHILDDGFQHLELARDLDILVTTPGEIANGRVIPFGRLREPKDAAAHADVLVVSGATAAEAAAEAAALGIPRSCGSKPMLGDPRPLNGGGGVSRADARILAVAAIGNPARFVDSLTAEGWKVADAVFYRDHHRFTSRDLRDLKQRFERSGATAAFTTSKDAPRFELIEPASIPLYAIPLIVNFDPEDLLFNVVDEVLT